MTSLAEAMTVLGILGLVLSAFYGVTYSMWDRVAIVEARQAANDEVRAAIIQLESEIRSGNVFSDPGTFTPANMRLVIYTQNRAGSFGDPNMNRCAEWLITSNDELQWRWYHPQWDPDGNGLADSGMTVTGWRTVAENVVNRDPDGDPATPPVQAFVRSGADATEQALYGFRTITIDLRVQPQGSQGDDPVQVSFSVTGRNTEYGYPVDVCSHRPADDVTSP